jgi:hypothetical protein
MRARSRSPGSHPARRGGRRCPRARGRRRAAAPPSRSASRCMPCRGGGGGVILARSTACQAPTPTQATSWGSTSAKVADGSRQMETPVAAARVPLVLNPAPRGVRQRLEQPVEVKGRAVPHRAPWPVVLGVLLRRPTHEDDVAPAGVAGLLTWRDFCSSAVTSTRSHTGSNRSQNCRADDGLGRTNAAHTRPPRPGQGLASHSGRPSTISSPK